MNPRLISGLTELRALSKSHLTVGLMGLSAGCQINRQLP